MPEKKDEQCAAGVEKQIDSLRKVAASGELSDELLEDVAGGAAHSDCVIHTESHTEGVLHTDFPN